MTPDEQNKLQTDLNDLKTKHDALQKQYNDLRQDQKSAKFGIVWNEVPEAFDDDALQKMPVLDAVPDLHICTNDQKPYHVLIEGDNYHALTCLNYTHEDSVDVIYIDPPYNTGSDGFRYKDKRTYDKYPDGTLVDKKSPYRHSYWLSFMRKRLELAQNLLKDTGVIFISIDDNEQAALKLLCDGIFGEENFIGNVIWQKKFSPQNDARFFSDNHDFILVYAKKAKDFKIDLLDRTDEAIDRYKNPDNDPRDVWISSDLTVKTYSAAYDYSITTPSGKVVYPTKGRCWNTSKDNMQKLIDANRIWFGEDGNNMPRLKKFLTEVKAGTTPLTIWTHDDVGHNQSAKQELKQLLADSADSFATPKPVKLIMRILELTVKSNPTAIILDFFAGSGTTAQAVMEMNKRDNGKRQCILVTNNEDNICIDICRARIEKVINGYDFVGKKQAVLLEKKLTWTELKKATTLLQAVKEKEAQNALFPEYDAIRKEVNNGTLTVYGVTDVKERVAGLGNSLYYYRTAFVGKHHAQEATDTDKAELAYRAGYLLAVSENTHTEIMRTDAYQIFKNNQTGEMTGVYFQERMAQFGAFAEHLQQATHATVYVFEWAGATSEYIHYFDNDTKIEVKEIPLPIVNIYKAIYEEQKEDEAQ